MAKITFITDTHYYSKTLGCEGEAYMLRSDSDQKCLGETDEIITSAFEHIKKTDCDAVAIIGDISNDGERVSHEEFRQRLYNLKKDKKICLITATHDWCCDENPRRFDGDKVYNDVPVMASDELYDFYSDFGFGDAVSSYKTHIGTYSYAVDIGDNITLLALNDDKNEVNHAGFVPEHFEWIKEQVKSAIKRGRVPVAMEHHHLYPHISPLLKGSCVAKGMEFLDALADAGLQFIFVGHTHIQRIDEHISPNGNRIFEINVASLVGYPAPMVPFSVDDNEFSVTTEFLKEFTMNGKTVDAQKYLKSHAEKLLSVVFDSADDKKMLEKRLTALGINPKKIIDNYLIIKPLLNYIHNLDIKKAGRIINAFTFGKAVPKSSVNTYSHKKVLDIVVEVFLSALDGSINKYGVNHEYYKLVQGAVSTPYRIGKKLRLNEKTVNTLKMLYEATDEILTGGKWDNHNLIIKRG